MRFLSRSKENARRPVSRVLCPLARVTTIHLGRLLPSASRDRPGRLPDDRLPTSRSSSTCRPYLVLLPVGFTLPLPLPAARCALTAPFHPYPPEGGRFAFCGTVPGIAPAGCYPAPCHRGARTFLPRGVTLEGGRPAVWHAVGRPVPGRGQGSRRARRAHAERSSKRSSRARVSSSTWPSMRPGRKWRWNAVTTRRVAGSSTASRGVS